MSKFLVSHCGFNHVCYWQTVKVNHFSMCIFILYTCCAFLRSLRSMKNFMVWYPHSGNNANIHTIFFKMRWTLLRRNLGIKNSFVFDNMIKSQCHLVACHDKYSWLKVSWWRRLNVERFPQFSILFHTNCLYFFCQCLLPLQLWSSGRFFDVLVFKCCQAAR